MGIYLGFGRVFVLIRLIGKFMMYEYWVEFLGRCYSSRGVISYRVSVVFILFNKF